MRRAVPALAHPPLAGPAGLRASAALVLADRARGLAAGPSQGQPAPRPGRRRPASCRRAHLRRPAALCPSPTLRPSPPSRPGRATRPRASPTRRPSAPRASRSTSGAARPATGSPCRGRRAWRRRCAASAPGPVDFYLSTGRMPLEQAPRGAATQHAGVQPPGDQRPDRLHQLVRRPGRADGQPGRRQPRARLPTVHAELRRLPPDRGPRRNHGQRPGSRPAGCHPAGDRRGGADGAVPDAALRLQPDRPAPTRLDRPLRGVDPAPRQRRRLGDRQHRARSPRGSWPGSSAWSRW